MCAKSITSAAAYYCVKKIAQKVQKYIMHYNNEVDSRASECGDDYAMYDRLTMDA